MVNANKAVVNSGAGKFKASTFLNKDQHRADEHLYTAEVWDLDADGFLDIVLASPNEFFGASDQRKTGRRFRENSDLDRRCLLTDFR